MSAGAIAEPPELRLARCDGLQDGLDPPGVDGPRERLEGDLDGLAGLDVARVDLGDLRAEEGIAGIDEGHHRRLRGDARALPERQVGHVAGGRRPHGGLVEVPLGALELGAQLVRFGLSLLDVEHAPGPPALQLRHLGESRLRELELRPDGIDLRAVRYRVYPKEDVAFLERGICLDRNIHDFTGDRRNDLDRVADDRRRPRGCPPAHRDEQPDQQEDEHECGRELPEQVERDEPQPDEQDEEGDVAVEQEDDHRFSSRRAGASTWAQTRISGQNGYRRGKRTRLRG
jgi:hypothetical protein